MFVGAATSAENTARCVPGLPDGAPNEIECGPLALRPGAHTLLVATLSAAAPCGAPFQLGVSSETTGRPFGALAAVTFAGSCTAATPRALTRPRLRRVGGVVRAARRPARRSPGPRR